MNNKIVYFFPVTTGLYSVSIDAAHVPQVGDRIVIKQLERIPDAEHYAYNKFGHWKVAERIFSISTPVTKRNMIRLDGENLESQHVEVYLVPWEE